MVVYPKVRVISPLGNASAVTMPLYCELIDPPHTQYLVKHHYSRFHDRDPGFPDNGMPVKVPTTELICHRLADLYYPKLCLPHCIVEISYEEKGPLKAYLPIPVDGPCFARRWIEAREPLHTGFQFRWNQVPAEFLAYYLVFQLWLCGQDSEILIEKSTNQPFSIDHDRYLGAQWDEELFDNKQEVKIAERAFDLFGEDTLPADLMRNPLNQLALISDEKISHVFADIPAPWLPHDHPYRFLKRLAQFTIERKKQVLAAIGV